LVALPFVGAPWAACAPPLAFRAAFGTTGCAWFGFTDSHRLWIEENLTRDSAGR
jgi:hypothetical protein